MPNQQQHSHIQKFLKRWGLKADTISPASLDLDYNGKKFDALKSKFSISIFPSHFILKLFTIEKIDAFPQSFDSRTEVFSFEETGVLTFARITKKYSYKAILVPTNTVFNED